MAIRFSPSIEAAPRESHPPPREPEAGAVDAPIAGAIAGDPGAVAALLKALAPEVVRVVRGVLGAASADADDGIQLAMIAIVQALPAFRGDCSIRGYACRIAFRTAVRQRKSSRRSLARDEEACRGEPHLAPEMPHEEAESFRRLALLRRLLDELPDEQAEALALRTMLGWTIEEIALASAAPSNTVRSRLRLAKESMRRRIEGDPILAERLGVSR